MRKREGGERTLSFRMSTSTTMRSRAEGASEKEFALFILRVVQKCSSMLFAAASRGRGALAQVGRDVLRRESDRVRIESIHTKTRWVFI